MGDITQGQIGPEGSYDVEMVDGKLNIKLGYDGADAGANLTISIKADKLLDALFAKAKAAIPGDVDDVIFDLIRGAILK